MRDSVDVVVVGGGPAGASVGIHLARAGFAVCLLDRARFPRDKACGEFLTLEARNLLRDLGAWDALCAAGARPVAATVLAAPDGRRIRHAPPRGGPTGYALRRVALDAALLELARQAGADAREGFAVRGLLRREDGAACGVRGNAADGRPTEVRARLVIGADGSHSLVARQLGLARPLPRLQRVALISHWQQVPGDGDTIEMRARGDCVCGLGFPGPIAPEAPGHAANLTLVVPTEAASRIAGRAGDFLEETLHAHFPDLAARLSGAKCETPLRTVGCFGHVCRSCAADGALLVGDAATFIDPFTGEGVYFALRGALLAAETAANALRAGDTSRARLRPYCRARRELARRYLLCDIVQAVVRQPALFRHVARRFDRFPGLADRLLSILSDTRPPADALHPGFLWRLLAPGI